MTALLKSKVMRISRHSTACVRFRRELQPAFCRPTSLLQDLIHTRHSRDEKRRVFRWQQYHRILAVLEEKRPKPRLGPSMFVPGAYHFYHSCRILHPKDNYKEELIPPYSVQSVEFKVICNFCPPLPIADISLVDMYC
jgi:hypothetical protein